MIWYLDIPFSSDDAVHNQSGVESLEVEFVYGVPGLVGGVVSSLPEPGVLVLVAVNKDA